MALSGLRSAPGPDGPPPVSGWSFAAPGLGPDEQAFDRLWRAFMTSRVGVGVTLTLLLATLLVLVPGTVVPGRSWVVGLSFSYLCAALAVRLLVKPTAPGMIFDPQWVSTIGVDLLAFSTLQYLQAGGLNYWPLFTLPVLTGAVLGSALLALGTAAAVTLLLLTDAWLFALQQPQDYTARFVQAGLTGLGYFLMATLGHQLATRLAREERTARHSLLAARTQAQVNELVIETLSQGVLVVDAQGQVHAANPAAWALMGVPAQPQPLPLPLEPLPAKEPLSALAHATFARREPQAQDVALPQPAGEQRLVHVRTRLTPPQEGQSGSLCVMFLQDLREMEARLRTEKLAAMGRMSAAVAHEIRNPLAAITQANELLAEDLRDPAQQQLSALVRQNAQRLARIVEEILDIARVRQQPPPSPALLHLDESVCVLCDEWAESHEAGHRVRLELHAGGTRVAFEFEHLRRVLVNLLDNALRHAGRASDSIRVSTRGDGDRAQLVVFSDGAPLDPGVQRHLFEPFFSSQSRSSGLGLYICRELCARHGASIGYRRVPASSDGGREGNEFVVVFGALRASAGAPPFDTIAA